jgi:hypothetical protein
MRKGIEEPRFFLAFFCRWRGDMEKGRARGHGDGGHEKGAMKVEIEWDAFCAA